MDARAEQRLTLVKSDFHAPTKKYRPDAKWRRLSVLGGYRLAQKRNIAHISCEGLADVLDVEISRQCVASWERELGLNLVYQSQLWNQSIKDRLAQPQPPNTIAWKITTVRADATNSSTLQSHKVHNCEISTHVHFASPSAVAVCDDDDVCGDEGDVCVAINLYRGLWLPCDVNRKMLVSRGP